MCGCTLRREVFATSPLSKQTVYAFTLPSPAGVTVPAPRMQCRTRAPLTRVARAQYTCSGRGADRRRPPLPLPPRLAIEGAVALQFSAEQCATTGRGGHGCNTGNATQPASLRTRVVCVSGKGGGDPRLIRGSGVRQLCGAVVQLVATHWKPSRSELCDRPLEHDRRGCHHHRDRRSRCGRRHRERLRQAACKCGSRRMFVHTVRPPPRRTCVGGTSEYWSGRTGARTGWY